MKTRNINSKLIIDTISNGGYFFLRFLSNIILYALFLDTFEINNYGVYIFFYSLIFQLDFLKSGFSVSLERYIPITDSSSSRSNLISIVSLYYLLIGALISLSLLLIKEFSLINFLSVIQNRDYVNSIILFAPILFYLSTFSNALRGFKDFRTENLINSIFLFIEIIVIIGLLNLKIPLEYFLYYIFSIISIRHVVHLIILIKHHGFSFSQININSSLYQFNKIKKFSLWNFVISVNGAVQNQLDKTLVIIFLSPSALAIYYGVMQFVKFYTILVGIINSAIIPYFSKSLRGVNNEKFNFYLTKGTQINIFLGSSISLLLILNIKKIFEIISKVYLIDYIEIFIISLIIQAFVSSRAFVNKLHISKGSEVRTLAIISSANSIIFPILLFVLSKFYDVEGAIVSSAIANLIIFPYWLFFVLKSSNYSYQKFILKITSEWFKVCLVFIPILMINYFLKIDNYVIIVAETLIIILILVAQDFYNKDSSIISLIKQTKL